MDGTTFLSLLITALLGLHRPVPLPVAKVDGRMRQNLNAGWEYFQGDISDIGRMPEDADWLQVDLPFTWNQWDATDLVPGYYRGVGCFRKTILMPASPRSRYLLQFEGVNMRADVYVNQQYAGSHVGGYVGFEVDISPYVLPGKKNQVLIRADNRYDPQLIPSQKSDFFIYGGIPRDVWLQTVPDTYLQQTRINTPVVDSSMAKAQVEIQVQNTSAKPRLGIIECALIDPEAATNEVVVQSEIAVELPVGESKWSVQLPMLQKPTLWSPDQPHLYTVRTTLRGEGVSTDQVFSRVGFRWYHFDSYGSFYLNGQRLLLRGTHRHEDHAGLGPAMSNEQHREDIRQIKEMGANFVRLAHYPQDPSVYDACDELGLIVWDELPWCRGGSGDARWEDNTRRLWQEQILQNFNHPSIFFWSLGNEIYWLPDFPGGDDTTQLNKVVRMLDAEAHRLDPQRLTALRKYYEGAHLVDVFSPSIWSGWYAGVYKNYAQSIQAERLKFPRFVHMEYGGDSHLGRHAEAPVSGEGTLNPGEWSESVRQAAIRNVAQEGDWSESYIVDLFDWYLGISETSDWFAGNAQWAFKDFPTPLRPENPIPYINQKGLLDRAGRPKDAYYVFKSYWAKTPTIYIESHTWKERVGPPGKPRTICVYSNCPVVDLQLNGVSLGTRERKVGVFPAAGLYWDLLFREGANQLVAQGYQDGKKMVSDTLEIQYHFQKPGSPYDLTLRAQPLPNGNQLIEATVVDQQGQRVLDYEQRIYFSSEGAGKLLVHYGTPTRSQVIEMANGYAAIELQPGKGSTLVEARNQDFKGTFLLVE